MLVDTMNSLMWEYRTHHCATVDYFTMLIVQALRFCSSAPHTPTLDKEARAALESRIGQQRP